MVLAASSIGSNSTSTDTSTTSTTTSTPTSTDSTSSTSTSANSINSRVSGGPCGLNHQGCLLRWGTYRHRVGQGFDLLLLRLCCRNVILFNIGELTRKGHSRSSFIAAANESEQ